MAKQLRLGGNKMLLGVCSGYAEFFGLDVTLIRIIMAILGVCGGAGVPLYLISWLVMYASEKN